ncbi:MAG: penicillin-binding protein [Lachnospiraceae bacterium]|nr:penicillin-binding protein [Lachnospiraceae bacterium]
MIKGILDSTPPISSFHFGPTNFATNIYNKNGDLVETLVKEGSNRESVKYEDIPDQIINAFVAIEDERFWEHSGVDLKSILRAVYGVLSSDSSRGGGSTITQQLIKNAVFNVATKEKGFEKYVRKLQEQYIALLYETQESMSKKEIKEQIITDYLNIINLGSNTLGIKVAIKKYFDKEVEDLKITDKDTIEDKAKKINESAVLAAITKNPSKNNPVTHPEENDKRRKQVLLNMKNQHYITDEEYNIALNDDVYSRIKNIDVRQNISNTAYTYFTDALIDEVLEALQKNLGYNYSLASNLLYSGGLSIYSTQDPKIQAIVDKEVNDDKNYTVKKYSLDYRLSILHKNGTQTHYAQQDIDKYNKETLKNKKYDGLFTSKDECDKYVAAFKKYIMKDDDSIVAESLNYILEPQCSFVLLDHTTGEVLAINGGRGEKTVSRSLNRATNTLRQPGSTFKVLTSFAPALELNDKTLADVYYDSEYKYKEKEFKNWYSSGFLGFQNIRNGIIYSLNIIAFEPQLQNPFWH